MAEWQNLTDENSNPMIVQSVRRGALVVLVAVGGSACAGTPESVAQSGAAPVTLRVDLSGAEALMAALARDSLTDADVDSLLRVHGVRAMVTT